MAGLANMRLGRPLESEVDCNAMLPKEENAGVGYAPSYMELIELYKQEVIKMIFLFFIYSG